MPSVVATAMTYGAAATNFAVVVKLVRTLMIIPISLALAEWAGHRIASQASGAADVRVARVRRRVNVFRLVPCFLIGFVVVAAINSLGRIPAAAHPQLSAVSVFLITVALSAIGLSTDLAVSARRLRTLRSGSEPVPLDRAFSANDI